MWVITLARDLQWGDADAGILHPIFQNVHRDRFDPRLPYLPLGPPARPSLKKTNYNIPIHS